jgi:hypothetical protein
MATARDLRPVMIAVASWLPLANRAPSGGNMKRGGSTTSLGPVALKRCSGGGNLLLAAKSAPFGACGNGAGASPDRANASNRIGAAEARPTNPGTGAPSGRPTQTPTVIRPSNPIAHASR